MDLIKITVVKNNDKNPNGLLQNGKPLWNAF